jgi:prepilin-type N-terminal cleavage/methylation domain-containing protein
MRKGFTLIEMMIAVTILAIIMMFLYKSYASLNVSNKKYNDIYNDIKKVIKVKKVVYLDFSLSLDKNINILNQEKNEDAVFLQTSNSIHNRINPYVAYVVKDKKLYRLESLNRFKTYPLDVEIKADVDELGEVERFRVYKATKKDANVTTNLYLVDIKFKDDKEDILYKIKALNQF